MSHLANLDHIDGILSDWKPVIGADFEGYRNHVMRMVTFCLLLRPCSAEEQKKIEIAACFHDLGIWTEHTLDYLLPSVPLALHYLQQQDLAHWSDEISRMILEHHKIRPLEDADSTLVELFRRGDLVDLSMGLVRFGLPRQQVLEIRSQVPNAGFHDTLLRKAGAWLVTHPLNPAPMMKW